MGVHDPLPDTLVEILREIEEICGILKDLEYFARHRPEIATGRVIFDIGVEAIGLLLGGPASLIGLFCVAYGFGGVFYEITKVLAVKRGDVEIQALRDALVVRRAKLWRKAVAIDPRIAPPS